MERSQKAAAPDLNKGFKGNSSKVFTAQKGNSSGVVALK